MSTEDRLNFENSPMLPLGEDSGDWPILTAPYEGPSAPIAQSDFTKGQPLTGPDHPFPASRRALGYVTVSDVVQPQKYRRVYQAVRVRRNELYRGPIQVVFQSSISAIMAEELGSLGGGTPKPTQSPARTTNTATHQGGNIRGSRNPRQTPPPSFGKEKTPAKDLPFDNHRADKYEAWQTIGEGVGNSINFEEIGQASDGVETDTTLDTLADIARPRSWARHTILEIQFRMPIMEPMIPTTPWGVDPIPFGDNLEEMERNRSQQNTIRKFTLLAGASHTIEIPYPVGDTIPIHFDIINHNDIYAANVNMSVLVYVTKE